MARTTLNGNNNNIINFLLYDKTNNVANALKLSGTTFVPIPCTINIGDSTSGFDGTLSDFRIFTGTGAIPGMTWISQQNCPHAIGKARGTHDPCFTSCYDEYCIECASDETQCTTCNQTRYLLNYEDGVTYPTCPASCSFYYVSNNALATCDKCTSGQVFFNGSCLSSCPYSYIQTNIMGCAKCESSQFYYNHSCVSTCPVATFVNVSIYPLEMKFDQF